MKRKKRVEPSKGKWRQRYLQLYLNKRNVERDKQRGDLRMLIYYTKTFNLNRKRLGKPTSKYQSTSKFYLFCFVLFCFVLFCFVLFCF